MVASRTATTAQQNGTPGSLLQNCVSGALAAASACLFSNPLDVAKVRMQLHGELGLQEQRSYSRFSSALAKIARREGLAGIQAGLRPALCYQICTWP